MLYAICAVIGAALLSVLYMLGRSHGRNAEREAYHDATEAYTEHLQHVEVLARDKEEQEKVAHAKQAEDALFEFDEADAKSLVKDAGVIVKTTMHVLVLGLGLLCYGTAHADPCGTVTSTVPIHSFRPVTPLERIYYTTAVCWRRTALDAQSEVRSATTALAACTAPVIVPATPSSESVVMPAILGGLVGAVIGVIGAVLIVHHGS